MEALIAVTIILVFSPLFILFAAVVWIKSGPAAAMDFFSALCLSIYMLVCRAVDK